MWDSQIDVLKPSAKLEVNVILWTLPRAPNAKGDAHRELIAPTRALLKRSGKPWVIENVPGAPLINPTKLCGSMFDLRVPDGAALRRHRLFETSFPLAAPSRCRHQGPVIGVYGGHNRDRRRPSGLNHRSGSNRPWEHAFIAMGVPIGSMTLAELSEAIPPVYARHVAGAFLEQQSIFGRTVMNYQKPMFSGDDATPPYDRRGTARRVSACGGDRRYRWRFAFTRSRCSRPLVTTTALSARVTNRH
jgi:hypothetical protein